MHALMNGTAAPHFCLMSSTLHKTGHLFLVVTHRCILMAIHTCTPLRLVGSILASLFLTLSQTRG